MAYRSCGYAICLDPLHFAAFKGRHHEGMLFFSLVMFLIGGMLYLIIIVLIFYRLMFFAIKPEAFTPPYWINMGAAAISTLAGAMLVLGSFAFELLGISFQLSPE